MYPSLLWESAQEQKKEGPHEPSLIDDPTFIGYYLINTSIIAFLYLSSCAT